MLPSQAVEVQKEEVPQLHFPNSPVLLDVEHRMALDRKVRKALSLGNNEHSKCRILFKDEEGLKFVETTVWSYDGEHIVLKAGVTVPFQRVIDVQVL